MECVPFGSDVQDYGDSNSEYKDYLVLKANHQLFLNATKNKTLFNTLFIIIFIIIIINLSII